MIITTYRGHRKYIRSALESIKKSINVLKKHIPNINAEVLVIDTSGDKEIEDICKQFNVIYIVAPNHLTIARNIGIERAKYEIILFMDSDCTADPNLLYEHIITYIKNRNEKLAGVVGLTVFKGYKGFGYKALKDSIFFYPLSFAKRMKYPPWGTTTNISFRRDVLKEVGGFKSDWPLNIGGEDVELGLRIYSNGYFLVSNPKAIVYHPTEPINSLWTNFKKDWLYGRSDYYLYKSFPNIRYNDVVKLSFFYAVNLTIILLLALCVTPIFLVALFLVVLLPLFVSWFFIKKKTRKSILQHIFSEITYTIHELGFIYEGIRHKDLKPIYKKVKYFPKQQLYEWELIVARTWGMFITMLIIVLLLFLILILYK